MKLHSDPRKSCVKRALSQNHSKDRILENPEKYEDDEYSEDFCSESGISDKKNKRNLDFQAWVKQKNKEMKEKRNKNKAYAENLAKIKGKMKEDAKNNFFDWIERKKELKMQEKHKKTQTLMQKSYENDAKKVEKDAKRFKDKKERMERLAKLQKKMQNPNFERKKPDTPLLLSYSTSKALKYNGKVFEKAD